VTSKNTNEPLSKGYRENDTKPTGSSKRFEGSYLGDNSQLSNQTKMECKICWHVYNPELGDDYWQVEPNTPFRDLPPEWSCPVCDGAKDQFMVIQD